MAGASLSTGISLQQNNAYPVGLMLTTGWTGPSLMSFQVSVDGSEYVDLYTYAATGTIQIAKEVTISIPSQIAMVALDPRDFKPANFIKVRGGVSGAAEAMVAQTIPIVIETRKG